MGSEMPVTRRLRFPVLMLANKALFDLAKKDICDAVKNHTESQKLELVSVDPVTKRASRFLGSEFRCGESKIIQVIEDSDRRTTFITYRAIK